MTQVETRWKNIKDYLPPKSKEERLVWGPELGCCIATFCGQGTAGYLKTPIGAYVWYPHGITGVTHWMPITLPKQHSVLEARRTIADMRVGETGYVVSWAVGGWKGFPQMNQCDCLGHSICDGLLYRWVHDDKVIRCHRHIILVDLWCSGPPLCSYYRWLDELDGDTAQMMYDLHREAVPLDYWEEI